MCFRNYIEYSCPGLHILLNSMHPFTLCELAENHTIPRSCGTIIDLGEKSNDWCSDCWMREHNGIKNSREGKKVWDDRWRGGAKWSGYGGEVGRDVWTDDTPQ